MKRSVYLSLFWINASSLSRCEAAFFPGGEIDAGLLGLGMREGMVGETPEVPFRLGRSAAMKRYWGESLSGSKAPTLLMMSCAGGVLSIFGEFILIEGGK
jgi:hypothetical protein